MNRVGLHQQQLSRNLAFSTVDGRERLLRGLPGGHERLSVAMAAMRGQHQRVRSTVRGYEHTVQTFCAYLTDGRDGWGDDHSIQDGQESGCPATRRPSG